MKKRIAGISMAVALPLLAATAARAAEPCVFDKYAPVTVTPYSEEDELAYGSFSFNRGAQLYIPAQKGLTAEWLQTTIERALAMRAGTNATSGKDAVSCSPNVREVRVAVASAGNGFWVTLIGRDEKEAAALLKWARSYVARNKTPVRAEPVTR